MKKTFLPTILLLTGLFFPFGIFSQNDCITPTVITTFPYNQTGLSTCGQGSDYAGYGCSGGSNDQGSMDYVFTFTPAKDTCINILINGFSGGGGPWDVTFGLMDACPGTPGANCLVSRSTFFNGNLTNPMNSGNVPVKAGITYYIIVDGSGLLNPDPTACYNFDITVSEVNCPITPLGDDCGTAITINTLPYSDINSSACQLTNNYTQSCLNGYNGPDKVYKYTAPKNQCITVYANNILGADAGDPNILSMWDNCPTSGGTCLQSDFDNQSIRDSVGFNANLIGGQTYYFIIGTDDANDCLNFDLHLDTCGAVKPPSGCVGGQNPPFMTGNEKGTDCGSNLGFESGDNSNWTGAYNNSSGQFYGPPIAPNVAGFNPAGGATNGPMGACGAFPFNAGSIRHSITTGNVFDPNSDNQIPVVAPSGGNFSYRLGNHEAGRGCECMERTFIPSASSPVFTYAFAVVLEDPSGHTNNERPRFEITLSDSAGPLACGGTYVVTSAGRTSAGFTQATNPNCINSGSQIWYRKWSTVSTDLTKYIGKPIKIKFCTADCARGGHYGYAYVDAFCQSKKIQGAVLCSTGGPTTLTAPPGFSNYSWYTGKDTTGTPIGSGPTIVVNPPDSVFTVVFEQVGTCCASKLMSTDTVRLFKKYISGSATKCNTDTGIVVISASSNDPYATYQWSPSTGLSCTTCATTNVQLPLAQTTTYTVTITSSGGCSFTDQVTVTINTCGINVVTYSDNVCEGVCGNLKAIGTGGTAPFTYTWQPGNLSGDSITVCSSTTATYTVTAMDSGGFTATSVATVNVTSKPNITATSDSLCPGKTTILTAGGGAFYTWSPATGLSSTTGVSVSANPPNATTYTVIGQTSLGCTNSTTATVGFYPPPAIFAAPQSICIGGSATLTGTGAYEYYWFPTGDTTNTIIVSPSVTSTYTLAGTSLQGCENTTTVVVTVNPLPVINATGGTICNGNSGTLTATGGNTYTWVPSSGLSSPFGSPVTASPNTTTTYTVYATDINGCTNEASTEITVNPLPTLTAPPQTICAGQSATFTAGGALSYTWMPGGSTSNPLTVTPPVTTSYTVTGTDANGCTNTAQGIVSVTPLPVVNLGNDTLVCGTLNLLLDAQNPGSTYLWSNASITQTIVATQTGTYWVRVTTNGCTSSDTITISPDNQYSVRTGDVCSGDSLLLDAARTGTYSWSTGATTQTIYIYSGGTYWVSTVNGVCNFIDTIQVTETPGVPQIIRIPNVFTPNSDHKNDLFDIEGLDLSSDYNIKIYDRWGLLMFESSDGKIDWNGTFKNKDAPQGVYYFILQYTDPCHSKSDLKHGFLHLMR